MDQGTLGAASDDRPPIKEGTELGPDGICTYRSWDSNFFGRRIAFANVNRLTEQAVQRVRKWCEDERIDCLYFLADSSHPETVMLAENAGFRLVDIRVTLERKNDMLPSSNPSSGLIRPYREGDLPSLRNIARLSHRDSRFYYDNNFPQSRCDALYETWIDKSAHGFADIVLVAVVRGEAVGYISCQVPPTGEPQIGLFAVAEHARGSGLGTYLIVEALRWFGQRGPARVTVVTQGRNVQGQRLYQRCGFVTRSVQLCYHYWPSSGSQGEK